jgi:enoyl-CoA hydratase
MIHREERGDITVLRMEHGKVNAMDIELCEAFSSELDELLKRNVRSVVLTSKGSTFSAGVDLLRLINGGPEYIERFMPALTDALLKLFEFPRPVIAAMNGHAVAGGFILACACDVRIMVDGNGRLGMPELLVGVPLPAIALEVLRFAVPAPYLAQLAYCGRTVTPTEALRIGMVEELVPENQLLGHAFRTANQMAAIPEKPFEMTKRELRAPFIERFKTERSKIDAEVLATWCSPETIDRIKTYIARSLKR